MSLQMTIEQQNRLEDLEAEIYELECDADEAKTRDKFATAQGKIDDWHDENDNEFAILKELEKRDYFETIKEIAHSPIT